MFGKVRISSNLPFTSFIFFNELKKHLNNQEKFTETILEKLEELGLLNKKNNNLDNEELNENEIDENQENNENENQTFDTSKNGFILVGESDILKKICPQHLTISATFIEIENKGFCMFGNKK